MESIRRIVPNINSVRMEDSRNFYTEIIGLKVAIDMGWIITLVSPDNPTAQISIVKAKETGHSKQDISLTIEVADVDHVYARAVSANIAIIYPLTNEPWGVRRFHIEDPNGVVINVMSHRS